MNHRSVFHAVCRAVSCYGGLRHAVCCVQWWSDPDLSIEVSAGSSVAKTTTKKNTMNPTWDETLLLWPEVPQLTLRVYDADTFSMQHLGCATLELGADWADTSGRHERVWPLALALHSKVKRPRFHVRCV